MGFMISENFLQEWQGIVDLLVSLLGVSAGLIMRTDDEVIEVFVSSDNEGNPYKVGDKEHLIGSGLYCETVISQQGVLLVPNALKSEKWKNNPDIKLNMISYLGFPINWPDGTHFGTICILDDKENGYSRVIEDLLKKFRDLVEKELDLIIKGEQLEVLSRTDALTGILNRRALFKEAELEIERADRYTRKISMLVFDIDKFKLINDEYGHLVGDKVLIELAHQIKPALRKTDLFGRFGGDEFIILLPETNAHAARTVAERIRMLVEKIRIPYEGAQISLTISIGISEFDSGERYHTVFNRADKMLYRAKELGRNQVCIAAD